jgi:myosin heavy subunit
VTHPVAARNSVYSHQTSLKDWLLLGAGAFGMGCLFALPWQRNLVTAAQVGLLTVPPVLLSVVILSRQRHRAIAQHTAAARLQLRRLRSQMQASNQSLQQQDGTSWGLQQQTYQLQTQAQHWQQTLASHQQQCQDYERYLAELDQRCRQYKAASSELVRTLAQRRQAALTLEKEIDYKQTQFHKLSTRFEQLKRQQVATHQAWQTAQSELAQVQAAIETQVGLHQTTQAELAHQMPELQRRWESLKIEAVSKEIVVRQLQQQTQELEEQHGFLSNQVAELNELVAQKQTLFEQVDRTLAEHQYACQLRERELQQLETTIAALRSERLDQEQELIAESSQWPILSLGESLFAHERPAKVYKEYLDPASSPQQSWQDAFRDNPHLEVLRHIEEHGVLTEAEAGALLGNPRLARQFANKLSEYTLVLPFAIRVEASATGNRYLKDIKH